MPGAGDTTNSTIVLDLAEELGMQEPTRTVISGKFLCEHSWGKGSSGQKVRESSGKITCKHSLSWSLLLAKIQATQAQGIPAVSSMQDKTPKSPSNAEGRSRILSQLGGTVRHV